MAKFKNAPNIKIPSTNGETFELKKIKNKFLVLYFYPKDDTPGCTIETKDFNTLLSKFTKLDCAVFGISKDDMKSHDKFKQKYKLKFDLLSDEKKEALKGKGEINNKFKAHIMKYLGENGVHTHYIDTVSDNESLVHKLDMLPVECVVRNIATGSI